MGKHRDHTVGKINAGPPLQRLPVKGAPLLHIICHIGDMHSEDIIFPIFVHRYRVIQILRILAVNSDHHPLS